MHRNFASLILFCAASLFALQPASAVTIQWSAVGDPGNAADPATGSLYGAVAYNYSIDKYEVTDSQYAAFLNAVAATDTYGLYNATWAARCTVASRKAAARASTATASSRATTICR